MILARLARFWLGKRPRDLLVRRSLPLYLEVLEDRVTPTTGEIHGTVWNDANGKRCVRAAMHPTGGRRSSRAVRTVDQNPLDAASTRRFWSTARRPFAQAPGLAESLAEGSTHPLPLASFQTVPWISPVVGVTRSSRTSRYSGSDRRTNKSRGRLPSQKPSQTVPGS